jgi:predicted CXXCH cytochrome family protein
MTIASSPLGVSLACLSCHDGTIAVDEIINVPNSFVGTPTPGDNIADCAGCHGPGHSSGFDFSATNLGQDLSNEHPISITYDPTADPDFNAAGSVTGAGLPLPSGRVECSSCHEPHSAQWRPFLQMDNANSAMCLTCHIK